jgi:uncharacterized membrane protein YgdD (TMEM256/DUF423 family)
MSKKIILAGVLFLLLGIILGAFGAHALKNTIDDQSLLNAFETGVRYQMYHGLAFLILGLSKLGIRLERAPFILMLIGVVLFSGSIYLLVLNPVIDYVLPEMIGVITPIGGTCLIISWILVFVKILKEKLI